MPSTITQDELASKIKLLLIDRFGLEDSQLKHDCKLRDLGVDSMHIVEIMLDLEDDVGMKLEGLAMPANPTLGDVIDTLVANIPPPQSHAKTA